MNHSENPMGTQGFAFVEFCTLDMAKLQHDFSSLGFNDVRKSTQGNVYLKQRNIDFRINTSSTYAKNFAKSHGASVCAMGFKLADAHYAFDRAIKLGAKEANVDKAYTYPAIYGVGDSLIYFVDEHSAKQDPGYSLKFENTPSAPSHLLEIDHLTHNVRRGQMDVWADFYQRLFNFKQIRYFDIHGKMTGLHSRAMTSPCGNIRIPINEATEDKSQIEEFIEQFKGEGIQHIALSTDNIYHTVRALKQKGMIFLDTPDSYFEMLNTRIPWHQENLKELQALKILMDGTPTPEGGLLLQIFTKNMLGPVFFEMIQRKGNQGFGEGNFQALFEAIERDQMKRGVL